MSGQLTKERLKMKEKEKNAKTYFWFLGQDMFYCCVSENDDIPHGEFPVCLSLSTLSNL